MHKPIKIIRTLKLILFWVVGIHMTLDIFTAFFFSVLVFPPIYYIPVLAALAGAELFLRRQASTDKTDRTVYLTAGSLMVLVCILWVVYLLLPLFQGFAVDFYQIAVALEYLAMLLLAAAVAVYLGRKLATGAAAMERVSAVLHLVLLAGMLGILLFGWDPYVQVAGSLSIIGISLPYRVLCYYIPLAGLLNFGMWLVGQVQETLARDTK